MGDGDLGGADITGTIVVADDTDSDRMLITLLLGSAGWTVRPASGGQQALALIRDDPPDLILLDIQMPDMSGLDLCRQLKHDDTLNTIPVIFISAGTEEHEKLSGFKAGGVDYITKPYRPAEVIARIRTHLELQRSRREILELNRQLMASNRELERISQTDALMGIANRGCFDRALIREWRRAEREKVPLSLIMVDVDHFKSYNDTYGHQAGDHCLRHVAQAAEGALHRPCDLLARYGGEELVVLLPNTPEAGALVVGLHMAQSIRDLGLAHRASTTASIVTASFGLATLVPRESLRPEDLIAVADAALYRAKESGRNRVEQAVATVDVTGPAE